MMGTESYRPYSAYKDSGVEWLGEIPGHWSLSPLWTMFRRIKQTGYENEELLSVYRDYGVIPKSSRDDNFNKASEDLSGYQLVRSSDLVINKMKAWQGSIAVSKYRGIVSPAYHVYCSTHSHLDRYLHYLLRSHLYASTYLRISKGIRPNQWDLEPEMFSRICLLLPSLSEQRAISAFLDRETARIDALVAKKERLIELLQEKRTALISHAVTKGLDPDVPMNDSGVEWLGEIPAHWEVVRIKHASQIQGGFAFSSDSFHNEGIPIIRMNNIRRGALNFESVVRIPEHECKDEFALNEGDIVYGLSGSIGSTGSLGNFAVVRESDIPAQLNQRVARFRPVVDKITDEFLVGALQTTVFYDQVLSYTTGTAQFNVSTNEIGNVSLALPSIEEQRVIAAFLDRELAKIDALVARVREAIDRLKELRTALISAAVTGKIDVRRNFG